MVIVAYILCKVKRLKGQYCPAARPVKFYGVSNNRQERAHSVFKPAHIARLYRFCREYAAVKPRSDYQIIIYGGLRLNFPK
jgi:hypothetical protein